MPEIKHTVNKYLQSVHANNITTCPYIMESGISLFTFMCEADSVDSYSAVKLIPLIAP